MVSNTASRRTASRGARKSARPYVALAILSPLLILGIWLVTVQQGWIRSVLLPGPGAVLLALVDMARNGYSGVSLLVHIGSSLFRVGTAFVLGAFAGIAIGILRGRVPAIDAIFLVPSEVIRPIPPLGMIPLFILWFGIGELSKILLIWLMIFFIVMINAQAGARSCPTDAIRAAQSLGASRYQVFRYIVFPASLPHVMSGLRIAMSTGLSILVASELLGGDRGLGFIILDAANFFRTTYVFGGIILIGVLGFLTDRCLALLARKVVHWHGRT